MHHQQSTQGRRADLLAHVLAARKGAAALGGVGQEVVERGQVVPERGDQFPWRDCGCPSEGRPEAHACHPRLSVGCSRTDQGWRGPEYEGEGSM